MREWPRRFRSPSVLSALLAGAAALGLAGCPPPGAPDPIPPPVTPPVVATCADTCAAQRAQLAAADQRVATLKSQLFTIEIGPSGKPIRVPNEDPQVQIDYAAAVKEASRLRSLLAACTSQYAPDVVTLACAGSATLTSSDTRIGTVSGDIACRLSFGPPCHSTVFFTCDPSSVPVDPSRVPSGVVLGNIDVSLQQAASPQSTIDVNRILTLNSVLRTVTPVIVAGISTVDEENVSLVFTSAPIPPGSGAISLTSNTGTFRGGFLSGSSASVAATLQCAPAVPSP